MITTSRFRMRPHLATPSPISPTPRQSAQAPSERARKQEDTPLSSSAPPGAEEITTTVTATGAGTYGFYEPVPVYNGRLSGLDYFPSPLARFPYNGFSTLEIYSPSSGLLDAGGTWITNIYLPGNWSRAGNADQTGTHLLIDFDPLWVITNDFVYDPATNRTLFSVVNTNYPGPDSYDNGPYPVILLTGPAVPEPGSIGLFGVGSLATVWWCLKRRR